MPLGTALENGASEGAETCFLLSSSPATVSKGEGGARGDTYERARYARVRHSDSRRLRRARRRMVPHVLILASGSVIASSFEFRH